MITINPPVYETSAILKVLLDCRPALRWLSQSEPTDRVPQRHKEHINQLERLAIVYKRNNRVLGVRRQRLKKLLARESNYLGVLYNIDDVLGKDGHAANQHDNHEEVQS